MMSDDHPPFPHRVSSELSDFLSQCFNKDPLQRPSAQKLRQHDWVSKAKNTHKQGAMGVNRLRGTLHKYNSFYKVTVESVDWKNRESGDKLVPTNEEPEHPSHFPPPNLHLGDSIERLTHEDPGALGVGVSGFFVSPEAEEATRKSTSPTTLPKEKASTLGVVGGSNAISTDYVDETGRRHSTTFPGPILDSTPSSLMGSVSMKKSKKKFNFRDLKESDDTPREKGKYLVNVVSTRNRKNFCFSFTEYTLRVELNGASWDIERTYDDFKELRLKLEKSLPNEKLPQLPPSKFFGVMDPDFVKKRSQQLGEFVDELIEIPAVAQSPVFIYFLR
eukprot:TRINITY_DN2822_c0_g1_i1.p2 TRINITY_DN2822_c0_g1~~TRINITY_DN2822_c0_g1_i1.p2  ORF type:complete len:332 (-),score=84.60 TRINITY_DN2822_c0_g1_i1:7-1002(-)